ncbi:MAG: hypothetical protein KDB04_07830 [Acidimicrobiales bacterium]|nr:hypothetical protein [Acidimicrobiales bacterium]
MPISQLLEAMDPPVPDEVRAAAEDLRYRDYMIVALAMRDELVDFDDNWIYIHEPQGPHHADPELRLLVAVHGQGGAQHPRPRVHGLGWATTSGTPTDEWLIERAKDELEQLGLCKAGDIDDGWVVRQPKAYPIYDERYRANVDVLRGLAGRARVERPPGRPQRHVPVQQPGPLHVHGHAHGREHRARAPPTTCGR